MSHRYFEQESHVKLYTKYRSIPPQQLIGQIITFLKDEYSGNLDIAADVGCGSGQSTALFAPYFDRVIGIDISSAMIEMANECNSLENVSFEVSAAEETSIKTGSVQLLSASTAAHWFDIPRFLEEGRRILCKNGVMSLFSYWLPEIRANGGDESLNSRLNEVFEKFYKIDFGECVSAATELAHRRYADIVFPDSFKDFQRIDTHFEEVKTTVHDISILFSTFSPYHRYCNRFGKKKGAELLKRMEETYMEILDSDTKPEDTFLIQKTSYFLILARNS